MHFASLQDRPFINIHVADDVFPMKIAEIFKFYMQSERILVQVRIAVHLYIRVLRHIVLFILEFHIVY